jgi:PilZ domain
MQSQAAVCLSDFTATLPNCRVHERVDCALPTTCRPATVSDSDEMRWNATICDISQGGARLLVPRRFEKGSNLAVELPGDLERESAIVFIKVVHLRREDDGAWTLGCKFVSELSEDEVQRLLTATHHVLSSAKKKLHDDAPVDPV